MKRNTTDRIFVFGKAIEVYTPNMDVTRDSYWRTRIGIAAVMVAGTVNTPKLSGFQIS